MLCISQKSQNIAKSLSVSFNLNFLSSVKTNYLHAFLQDWAVFFLDSSWFFWSIFSKKLEYFSFFYSVNTNFYNFWNFAASCFTIILIKKKFRVLETINMGLQLKNCIFLSSNRFVFYLNRSLKHEKVLLKLVTFIY